VLGILDLDSDVWRCQGYCRRDMLEKKRLAILLCEFFPVPKYWNHLSEGQNRQVI